MHIECACTEAQEYKHIFQVILSIREGVLLSNSETKPGGLGWVFLPFYFCNYMRAMFMDFQALQLTFYIFSGVLIH